MLAVDLGASNGRVVWGQWRSGGLACRELHRFENVPIRQDGLMCWDIPRLTGEISQGISAAAEQGLPADSLGLCSWGNTVGLIGGDGGLVRPPIHYREPRTDAGLEPLYAKLGRGEMFRQTLYLPMAIQPAPVLSYLMLTQPETMERTRQVLMISDLFNYLLSGRAASERTMAATSGMLDMRTGNWSRDYMARAGIDQGWFPDIVDSRTVLGPLKDTFAAGDQRPAVVAVAGHDTASASGLVDAAGIADSLYLSCGTWSCMGCGVDAPRADEAVLRLGVTNDLGPDGDHQLRFNHTGLWILQECRRYWREHGRSFGHAELAEMARAAGPQEGLIDTEDELFFRGGDMPNKVAAYLERTGQPLPQTPGQTARIILESLAMRYRYSAQVLSRLAGTGFASLRMFGGGCQNSLLCQLVADALGVPVTAGPAEASTIGNFVQQGLALGVFAHRREALALIGKTQPKRYIPIHTDESKYRKALEVCQWKL